MITKLSEFWPYWRTEIATRRQYTEDIKETSVEQGIFTILQNQKVILKALLWLLEEVNAGES